MQQKTLSCDNPMSHQAKKVAKLRRNLPFSSKNGIKKTEVRTGIEN